MVMVVVKPSHPHDNVDGVVIGGAGDVGGHGGIVCDFSSQDIMALRWY